jgi:hypothetical protein
MKLPDVSGVYDYAGPSRDSRYRPVRVAFRQCKSVSVLIASFRSSIPSPPVPLFTLRTAPHGALRKTRGRVVRYSFLVGLLHSLLHAGLSRRTASAIWQQLRQRTDNFRIADHTSDATHKSNRGRRGVALQSGCKRLFSGLNCSEQLVLILSRTLRYTFAAQNSPLHL